jgi:hypothetical protein
VKRSASSFSLALSLSILMCSSLLYYVCVCHSKAFSSNENAINPQPYPIWLYRLETDYRFPPAHLFLPRPPFDFNLPRSLSPQSLPERIQLWSQINSKTCDRTGRVLTLPGHVLCIRPQGSCQQIQIRSLATGPSLRSLLLHHLG